MKINEIIYQKRKEQKLTQEQVAEYLGVSTPAVNKWEKGNTYPDITTLPALARLLNVDLNTLLSFHEDLSEQEISVFSNQLFEIMQEQGFEIGFQKAIEKIQVYPTCDMLIYTVALGLEGGLFIFPIENMTPYESEIEKLYERVANSKDTEISNQAISMLISKYIERKEYEKAQAFINRLPNIAFDKKLIQATLYIKQEKFSKATELLEHKLINDANKIQLTIISMMEIALEENEIEKAEYFANTARETARLYDLWNYSSHIAHFRLAAAQRNSDECITKLKLMLSAIKEKWDISSSPLYQHVKEKSPEDNFGQLILSGLLTEIQNDEVFSFLKSNSEFRKLLDQYDKTTK